VPFPLLSSAQPTSVASIADLNVRDTQQRTSWQRIASIMGFIWMYRLKASSGWPPVAWPSLVARNLLQVQLEKHSGRPAGRSNSRNQPKRFLCQWIGTWLLDCDNLQPKLDDLSSHAHRLLHFPPNLAAHIAHMSSLPCGKLPRHRRIYQARWRRDRVMSVIGPVRAHKSEVG
jgi:hypothetical protein